MKFLEIVEFILRVHDETGLDHQKIGGLLESRGISLPWYHVRDVIDMLHDHPPSVQGGPTYGVEWAMRGFDIITETFPTIEKIEDICDRLKKQELNYDWDIELIHRVILAHDFWLESNNGFIPYPF